MVATLLTRCFAVSMTNSCNQQSTKGYHTPRESLSNTACEQWESEQSEWSVPPSPFWCAEEMNFDGQPDGEWSDEKQLAFQTTLQKVLADSRLYELVAAKNSPSGYKLKETQCRRRGLTYFALCVNWKRRHVNKIEMLPSRSAVTVMRQPKCGQVC